MRRYLPQSLLRKIVFVFVLLLGFVSKAQIIQVEIIGGAIVTQG